MLLSYWLKNSLISIIFSLWLFEYHDMHLSINWLNVLCTSKWPFNPFEICKWIFSKINITFLKRKDDPLVFYVFKDYLYSLGQIYISKKYLDNGIRSYNRQDSRSVPDTHSYLRGSITKEPFILFRVF